jgi:hypothetical protein
MIEKGEEFLVNLYIKCEKNLRGGCDVDILQKMMGIEPQERDNIVYYLKQYGYVDTSSGYGNKIILNSPGIDFARDYLKERDYKIIKFKLAQHVPFSDVAAAGYLFYYDLIDKNKRVEEKAIRVMASDILMMTWQLNFSPQRGVGNAEKILLQVAKEKISEKLREGSLNDYENVVLLTASSPKEMPYNVRFLPNTTEAEFVVFLGESITEQIISHVDSSQNKSAISIVELRDQINAVFKEKFGLNLLNLNEERSVINLFKISRDRESFHYWLNSFGEMSRLISAIILRSLTGIADTQTGSVQLLKEFAIKNGHVDLKIVEYLTKLGHLRQGYPTHTDNERVIQAHRFFQFNYPIQSQEFDAATVKLLEIYKDALQELFDFIYRLPKNI